MFFIACALFLACAALFLFTVFRLRRTPSRRLTVWLAGSAAAVLVLAASGSVVLGQLGIIANQQAYLNATLKAYSVTKAAVAGYSANGESVSIPCSRGLAAARRFSSTYAMAPAWRQVPVSDHSTPAVLTYMVFKGLEAKGCVARGEVESVLGRLRGMQAVDAHGGSLAVRFLRAVPIGLLPWAPSLRSQAGLMWAELSPHAIAERDCFTSLAGWRHFPSDAQVKACHAPVPRVTGRPRA